MNGAIAGDLIGSPYRELDTKDAGFGLMDSATGVVGGRLLTAGAGITGVGLYALAVMRWLTGEERGDGHALGHEIAAMHARYPDVTVSRDMWRWLESGSWDADEGTSHVKVRDTPVQLVGAALCGLSSSSSDEAENLAETLCSVTGSPADAAVAVAAATCMAASGRTDGIMGFLKGRGIDLEYGTSHEELRSLMVRDSRMRVSLDELGDFEEVHDPDVYIALQKASMRRGAEPRAVSIPYAYHRKADADDVVRAAVASSLNSPGWLAAAKEAVTLGGDSAVVASLAGVMSQALYGPAPSEVDSRAEGLLDPYQRSVMETFDSLVEKRYEYRLLRVGDTVRYSDAPEGPARNHVRDGHPSAEFLSREDLDDRYAMLREGRLPVNVGQVGESASLVSVAGIPLYSDASSERDIRFVLENFGTGVTFLSRDDLMDRVDTLRGQRPSGEVTIGRVLDSFSVVSVDGQPRYSDAATESQRAMMRLRNPGIVFLSSDDLQSRYMTLDSESRLLRARITMESLVYRPGSSLKNDATREVDEYTERIVEKGRQQDIKAARPDDSFLILKRGSVVVASSAGTVEQRDAVRHKYGTQVEFLDRAALMEKYRIMDSESRRPEIQGARLAGIPVQVRSLFMDPGGLKGVSNTGLLGTDPAVRAGARADFMRLREEALKVCYCQDSYLGNTSGRPVITESAYRVEVYDDSVVGWRGESDRDEIGISPATGLLYRRTADDFHAGEYSSSDKMIARMFDGCELYDRMSGTTRVSVDRAIESMRMLCLDDGVRDSMEQVDEETGYRMDSSPYWGEQTVRHLTNLERLDEDIAGSEDPALLKALGMGSSRGMGR